MCDQPAFAAWLAGWQSRQDSNEESIRFFKEQIADLHPDAAALLNDLEDGFGNRSGLYDDLRWRQLARHLPSEFAGLIDALSNHIDDAWGDQENCCASVTMVEPSVRRPRWLLCLRPGGGSVSIHLDAVTLVEPHPERSGVTRVWLGERVVEVAEDVDSLHDALVGWPGSKTSASGTQPLAVAV